MDELDEEAEETRSGPDPERLNLDESPEDVARMVMDAGRLKDEDDDE